MIKHFITASIAFAAGFIVVMAADWPNSQPTFALTQTVGEDVYVLDHGLIADDCQAYLRRNGTAIRCELERAN